MKVKVKCSDSATSTRKNLLSICYKFAIKVERVNCSSGNEFDIFCADVNDVEILFTDEVLSALSNCFFTPILPNELKANRTVFIPRVDKSILENSLIDIKNEIVKCNSWTKVVDVVKIPNSSNMKLTFTKSAMTDRAIVDGISLFHMHIPGTRILPDKHIVLNTCYICYAVEQHDTQHCPKKRINHDFVVCPKCSLNDHDYKSCTVSPSRMKCINCDENHHSMAMKCSIRKNALRKRRLQPSVSVSMASVVRSSNASTTNPSVAINEENVNKAISITILAIFKNMNDPGTFSQTINSLYKDNGLPILNLNSFEPPNMNLFTKNVKENMTDELSNDRASTFENINASSSVSPSVQDYPKVGETTFNVVSPSSNPSQNVKSLPKAYESIVNVVSPNSISSQTMKSSSVNDWNKLKLLKHKGIKIVKPNDIISAWEDGNLLIMEDGGNIPSYAFISKLVQSGIMPTIENVLKSDLTEIAKCPRRFFQENT